MVGHKPLSIVAPVNVTLSDEIWCFTETQPGTFGEWEKIEYLGESPGGRVGK